MTTMNLSERLSLALISYPHIATHTDPVSNNTVKTALFVDTRSGGTFGVDVSYIEHDQWWCNNPFDRSRILLSGNSRDNILEKGALDENDVDQDLLILWMLVQYALYGAPHHGDPAQLLQDITQRLNDIVQPDTPLTAAQISLTDLNAAILSLLSPLLPSEGKLFFVLPENMDCDRWVSDVKQEPEALITPELWFDPVRFHPVSGWTQQESDRIAALNVGQVLFGISDFYHTLFRLR